MSVSAARKPTKLNKSSGIYGKVVIGPVSPISKIGVSNEKPYKATIIVQNSKDLNEITQFTSSDNGYFRVYLNPGTYILKPAQNTILPRLNSIIIEVEKGKLSFITISYDSGIR
jgi:hypothetical protein